MNYLILGVVFFEYAAEFALAQSNILRGPPQVETNPKLSNSYIPAAMQIIAHDTELMKYVINAPQGTTTTTTTVRPTPSHRPAVFAPLEAPGPSKFFSEENTQAQYNFMQQQPVGLNYFDRYNNILNIQSNAGRKSENDNADHAEQWLGKSFGDIFKLANRIDYDQNNDDIQQQMLEFSKDFEDQDSVYRYELLRQKVAPPTQAYVTLLSLYDRLSKESKRLMLNRFSGFNDDVLAELIQYSASTSNYQLREVLNKIIQNNEIKNADVSEKIKSLISDLDVSGSYINEALKDIPPLVFAP